MNYSLSSEFIQKRLLFEKYLSETEENKSNEETKLLDKIQDDLSILDSLILKK